ncbi:MAG: glycosyltransferase family 4 protein [Actinobacteria bacterium]|nr:glycosyltransferase family 4 protein [Actinomycetota bacterium]MBU2111012.1 glycosyltransferase family 4 protein [Actinomycetota bacterium]
MSRKRVTLLSLHYSPEQTGNAPYAAGLAKGLAARFDVDVVTAHPHYPEWRIAPGYGGWRRTEGSGNLTVHRLRHFVPKKPTGIGRIVSEGTFAARTLSPRIPRPDVVLTMTPALAPVASALALGRRWRVPVGVIVQDLYSKAFSELGLMGGRLNEPAFRLEASLLRRASGVVSIHPSMAKVICRDFGVSDDQIAVVPNWTHVTPPTGDRTARRRELGWDDGKFTVVHAGNMGAKQGLEHLIPVGRMLDSGLRDVRLVLIGNGGHREQLENAARGISSIEFMDALPSDTFMDTLSAADALLLHERPGMKEMCVPSKLTTYFAAKRPILGVSEPESAASYELRASGAGVQVRPGTPAALVSALELLRSRDTNSLGEAGFAYAQSELSESSAIDRYVAFVESLLGENR